MDVHDSTTFPDKTIERFWGKVDRSAGPDACWPWTASLRAKGYGGFTVRPKTYRAHRFAYMVTHGPIPAGLVVMHQCDNRACCNPGHLQTGTIADNNHDMTRKGRNAIGDKNGMRLHPDRRVRGEASPNAKLTNDLVALIRSDHASGISAREIARRMGVCPRTIGAVVKGEGWTHVVTARTQQEAADAHD